MHNALRALAVALAVVVLLAPMALAADDAGSAEGQKSLLDLDLVTALATIAVFVVLLIVLTKAAWKPILGGLQQREAAIKKALDDAAQAHATAKALIAQYESRLQNAREEAQSIFDEARRDAQEIRRQIEQDAQARADETVERSRREIDQLQAKAWDRVVRDAAAVASEAAGRIIRKQLVAEDHAALVADVVSEFTQKRQGA